MGLSSFVADITSLKGAANFLVSLESFVNSAEGQALIADAKAFVANAEKLAKDLATVETIVTTVAPAV